MSRKDEVKTQNPNPAEIWMTWDSDNGQLKYWDKEKGENGEDVPVKLPFTFVWLKQLHTVKGFSEDHQSGIFANEVMDIGQEEMTVKAFKASKPIATGIYADIKQDVIDAGGHYVSSIYAMTKKGTLINISFKGSCVQAWSEFIKKVRNRLPDEWVKITSAQSHKKGKITWTTPEFAFAGSLKDNDSDMADACYETIQGYFNEKSDLKAEQKVASDQRVAEDAAEAADSDDDGEDVPF